MKLVAFEIDNKEYFGFTVVLPQSPELWVIEPGKAERMIHSYAVSKTSGYQFSIPKFLGEEPWPVRLIDFLQMGDRGMQSLHNLQNCVLRFLEQSDAYALLAEAGHPFSELKLLPPVSSPRLLWGIVGNNPAFTRNHMDIKHLNLIPQGHQRHCCAVIGAGEPFVFRNIPEFKSWSYNVELGVVIGKKCRNVLPSDAMSYVAGYTVVNDINHDYYYNRYPEMLQHKDPYSVMAYAWTGKNTDNTCAIGPWLVTKDEIGHPYDLDVFIRMNGILRDHANTCSMLMGIERIISYYSSFATLYPGDIIHLGANGKDGLVTYKDLRLCDKEQIAECEIEKIGVLRNPVIYDSEPIDEESIPQKYFPIAAKRLIQKGETSIEPKDWKLENTRNFLITYGNYTGACGEGGCVPCNIPRYMWAPNSALGIPKSILTTPSLDSDLHISAEIAVVIRDIGKWKNSEQAKRSILGYLPMISVYDNHLAEELIQPALPREWAMASIYARWSDSSNIIGDKITPMCEEDVASLEINLFVDGALVLTGNSKHYVCCPSRLIETLTFGTTLLPGDILSLGRIGEYTIPAEQRRNGQHSVVLRISGLPELSCLVQ